ncbi:MAG: exodeoxyribonuclease VII small subunit [Suilimivivens sp.]
MEDKEEIFSLEEAFLKLDETVATLERDDITLEQSFKEYQKGMELLKKCNETIDKVEKKVLILNENGETDEF